MHTILSHNGTWTIESPTGEHRTFRVKTQPDDAGFAPGERILSIMTGPNNTFDFKGFAFIKPDGRKVILWKKYRKRPWTQYVKMLLHPWHYEKKGVTYHAETRCRACNRKLTRPDSIAEGIGPVCAGR